MVWSPVRSDGCVAGARVSTRPVAGPPSGSAIFARAALRTRWPGQNEIVVFLPAAAGLGSPEAYLTCLGVGLP